MSDRWDDVTHGLEVYGGLTWEERERLRIVPKEAWAWLAEQLEQLGWVWTVTSGYAIAHAQVLGPGDRSYSGRGRTPLIALARAFIAAKKSNPS